MRVPLLGEVRLREAVPGVGGSRLDELLPWAYSTIPGLKAAA